MPIYEFHCKKCDKTFERLVPMGRSQEKCSKCGVLAEKMISQVAALDLCVPKTNSGFG
jgi:putative FmdB family regulatory protein